MAAFHQLPFGAAAFRRPSAEDAGLDRSADEARLRPIADFGDNPGRLAAKVYVPGGLEAGAPLVVVLHGCTQAAGGHETSVGWSALADEHRFAVLFPEQRRANNPKLCFSWFRPDHVARDAGEAASIRQMIEAMLKRRRLDRRRVFVTGLSAGGAMANVMLATYPEVFAAGSIVAGLPYGAASGVGEAFTSMSPGKSHPAPFWGDQVRAASPHQGPWPKVTIWHGDADATVAPLNAHEIAKQWTDVHRLTPDSAVASRKGRLSRRVWGGGLVELNVIAGMGHGTPLDARLGEAPGPFMLDVGVSQARASLVSWGLASAESATARRSADAPRSESAAAASRAEPRPTGRRRPEPQSPRPAGLSSIEATITKALRAAGLMR